MTAHRAHVVIRRAVPQDWERVRALRLAALRDTPDAFGSTHAREEAMPPDAWQRWITGAGGDTPQILATFVGVDAGGDFCGMATGSIRDAAPVRADLYGMWVAPQRRGSGLGRALVGHVMEWAAGHGATHLHLRVTGSNRSAIGLYEALGFMLTGDEPTPLREGSDLMTVAMVRALPPVTG